jgi:hypothetical protein
MKTGAIIYVAGDEPQTGFETSPGEHLKQMGVIADQWELVTHNSGHFDIHDAWYRLMTRGMQQVLCMAAEVNPDGGLRLTGRQMRLCG